MPTRVLVPADLSTLSAHDVLAGGLEDQVAANFYAAQQLERLDEFFRRREADHLARRAASSQPHFVRTPLQETALEASSLWGKTEHEVRRDLRTVRTLKAHFSTQHWQPGATRTRSGCSRTPRDAALARFSRIRLVPASIDQSLIELHPGRH
jgi:hypothetical protein